MGKSEVVSALAADTILTQQRPVLICKPEEATVKSYQMLVGKAAGRIFHDPKVEFDEEAYDAYEPFISLIFLGLLISHLYRLLYS